MLRKHILSYYADVQLQKDFKDNMLNIGGTKETKTIENSDPDEMILNNFCQMNETINLNITSKTANSEISDEDKLYF